MDCKIVYGDQRDDFHDITRDLINGSWPEFMMHDRFIDLHYGKVFDHYANYQFALLDDSQKVVAVGNSFGLHYEGGLSDLPEGGLDWALDKSASDIDAGIEPNMQCAFQIVIDSSLRGKRMSSEIVKTMTSVGRKRGFDYLIAPVRPNQKCDYPLTDIDRYIKWKNEDGLPFDAWIRVHKKLGAEIVNVCHRSMDISGTVAEWTEWTGMKFPESGEYIIPKALIPIKIDLKNDTGQYFEPNVWMAHRIG